LSTPTPAPAHAKRDRNGISGVSESNVQIRLQYSQATPVFNSSNTLNQRHRGINQQRYEDTYLDR